MKSIHSMRQAAALALVLLLSWLLPLFGVNSLHASAVSADYPPQLMNIAVKDSSKVLTETGTDDNAALTVKALGNDLSPTWRFDRVNTDSKGTFFKITSAQSGRLLTPKGYSVKAGNAVVIYGSESAQSQHWYVIPVKQDRLGNDLYYKIVNYSDTNLALTQAASGMTLETYSGADSQLWLLNCDGLQGFAGYCKDDNTGSIKAGDIGGLFGEVVEAGDFATLKKYAESDVPYTIIVNKNISVNDLNLNGERYMCTAGRIYVRSNKTIIGSYGAHTLFNVQFCTATKMGVGNNIIIKNFDIGHDAESNNNDSIQCYFGSGENIWVDHVTFTGHNNYGYAPKTGKVDEDKFLACCYDADYCTVSDSSFGAHKYGLILGYPSDDEASYKKYNNFPRMSIIGNRFHTTETRGPGLMRYGYFHSLNNYVYNFSMAYTVHTASKIFAENCYYDGGSIKGNVICDWNSVQFPGSYAETGSKATNCKRTTLEECASSAQKGSASYCNWKPSGNYSYVSLSADQAKNYTSAHAGCQKGSGDMMYLRYGKQGIPSAGYTEVPSGPAAPVPASFSEGAAFRFKNVNSGQYLQVAGAAAENGTNVQQWGSTGTDIHDVWKLYSAGDGYYYILSCVGDGATYALDVVGKKTANGTNIDIYQYNGGTNQQFMLTENSDGSYTIRTRITSEASVVEVADGSKESGANVQQWESSDASCQKWIMEACTDPGTKMDTSVLYTLKNVNSGLVMDIVNADMKAGTNVQQWEANGLNCQKWILKDFGSGNYYWIRSAENDAYALKAEGSGDGGNIGLAEYSSKDSAQLFRFTRHPDGSYSILTHASKDACLVEVEAAKKDPGANIQQWSPTNSSCQKWELQTETTTAAPTEPPTTETTTEPATEPAAPAGDVNGDGKADVLDLVTMQKWLLAVPGTKLADKTAADLDQDGVVDVFDLALLKRVLVRAA